MPCPKKQLKSYLSKPSVDGRCTSDLSRIAALRMTGSLWFTRNKFTGGRRQLIGLPAPGICARGSFSRLFVGCILKSACARDPIACCCMSPQGSGCWSRGDATAEPSGCTSPFGLSTATSSKLPGSWSVQKHMGSHGRECVWQPRDLIHMDCRHPGCHLHTKPDTKPSVMSVRQIGMHHAGVACEPTTLEPSDTQTSCCTTRSMHMHMIMVFIV